MLLVLESGLAGIETELLYVEPG